MAQWTEIDPGAGDMDVVGSWAATEAADHDAAAGISGVLGQVLRARPSHWNGAGADAWTHTVTEQNADILQLQNASTHAAAAARVYASKVDDIRRAAAVQTQLLGSGRLSANQTYLDDASNPPPASVLAERAADHADAVSQVRGAQSALSSLADERRAADAALISALRGAVSPTWPAEKAAFAAVGIAHPDRLSVSDIDRRVDDFITGLEKSGGSHYTSEQAAAVLVFAHQGTITPAQVLAVFKRHPALAAQLEHVDATVVSAWWKGMDALPQSDNKHPVAQESFVKAMPAALGNLNGVAYWARDEANRHELAVRLAAAKAEFAAYKKVTPVGQYGANAYLARLAYLQRQVDSFSDVQTSLIDEVPGSGIRQLITLTSDSPPLASVSVGDLDTAADVTYLVPGMGSDAAHIATYATAAQNIYSQQLLVAGRTQRSVVAWVNYKAPPVPSTTDPDLGVLRGDRARAGARRLESDLVGLNAARRGTEMSLNVIGHSYGATTASIALAHANLHVEAFVSVASAGIERNIKNASDIHAAHVYAEQARSALPGLENGQGDQWAWTGRDFSGRQNPMAPSFGATTFNASGNPEAGLTGVTAHDALVQNKENPLGYGYFDPNTESLNNIALATTRQGNFVSPYKPQSLTPLQQGLLNAYTQGQGPH